MKKLKKIIPLLCILILAVIFSACAKEDATVEESHWELYAVTSFKNNEDNTLGMN
jgi:PBP1b-binding outer membrane lipoprotein LpoB